MPKHKYIFPNFLAEIMNKVSQRVQYEATMMSMTFILIGILGGAIYSIIATDLPTISKWFIGGNAFFAFVWISSGVVGTYQQYVTYLEAIGFEEELKPKETELSDSELLVDFDNDIEEFKKDYSHEVAGGPKMDISQYTAGGQFLKADEVIKEAPMASFVITSDGEMVTNQFQQERLHLQGEFKGENKIFDCSKTNARFISDKLGTDTSKWIGNILWLETYKTKTNDGKLVDAINVKEVKEMNKVETVKETPVNSGESSFWG